MRYSWPLFVVGVAVFAWSRLGNAPALGIVGLVLMAIAVSLWLRARRGTGRPVAKQVDRESQPHEQGGSDADTRGGT